MFWTGLSGWLRSWAKDADTHLKSFVYDGRQLTLDLSLPDFQELEAFAGTIGRCFAGARGKRGTQGRQGYQPASPGAAHMKWWRQRSSRQKQALMVASASLSAVVLFLLLEPLVEERRRLSAELPRLREDLAWMEAHVDKAKKLSVPAATEGQQVSPAQVESLLQQTGIRQQVAGMQPLAGQECSSVSIMSTFPTCWCSYPGCRMKDMRASAVPR